MLHYTEWTKKELYQVIPTCIEMGFTEADVRDYRECFMADQVMVRMWNYRKVIITGLQIYQTKYGYGRIKFTGAL